MRFFFQDVIKLQLNVVIVRDFKKDVFNIFKGFLTDTPHALGFLKGSDSETITEFGDLIGWFF